MDARNVTHLHLCENLSFLALLQAGTKCSHHMLLCTNHLHNLLVTLNAHSLEEGRKIKGRKGEKECWLGANLLTFAYANFPIVVSITPNPKRLLSETGPSGTGSSTYSNYEMEILISQSSSSSRKHKKGAE